MKTILVTLIFGLHSVVLAQTLTPESEKVRMTFLKLSADTNNKKLQTDYINAFPSDIKTFLAVFHSSTFDQLYHNSHEYFVLLEKCARQFPEAVIGKCIDIGKDLSWDADAVSYLQHLSVRLAGQFPKFFVKKFKTLSESEKDKLIAFYADVENHSKFFEFQMLVDNLKSNGDSEIAKKLETARTNRQKRTDH